MAVTVTDNRTVLYSDGITNITGADETDTTFYAEAASSAAWAINIGTDQIFWNGTTPNFSAAGNELIYVWSSIVATQNGYKEATAEDSSHALYLSDGTDELIVYQAGNDRDVFKHAEGQVSFQCMLIDISYLDTVNTNGDLAAISGSYANFDETTTSMDVGAHYTTLSKALGGGNNCYLDIIRYGGADDGIQITGGTTGDRGTFAEVCVEDRNDADGKAHGIIREYTGGAYGVQGTLRIGDTGTATTYFEESNFTMTFEDRLVDDDKYQLIVEANSTGTNLCNLSNATISSARPGVTIDISSNNIDELQIDGCTFVDLLNAITFPGDTNGTTLDHDVINSTFNNCGQIDIGKVAFSGNTINNTNAAASTEGAIYIDNADVDNTMADITFNEYTGKYAVYITTAVTAGTTLVFDNIQFDGSGTDVYWAGTTGTLTISKTNASNPSTSATGGGTVSFVGAAVTATITATTSDGSPIEGAKVLLRAANGTGPFPYQESVSISRSGTDATVTHTGHGLGTGDKVELNGITDKTEDNGIQTITVTGVNAYTYTTTDLGSTSYTGTITSTFVALSGNTDSSGQISSAAKVYPSDQPVTGWARKSSSSPYYKTGPINNTIDDALGLNAAAILILDE